MVCDRIVGWNVVVQKYYKFVGFILWYCGIVARTFVLANICLVGEKAKIVHFISKNKIFFFLYKRVYHFHPPHPTPPLPHPTTTTTQPLPKPPTTTKSYPQPPFNHYHTLPTIPPYQTIKLTNPTLYHNPLPPKKPTK